MSAARPPLSQCSAVLCHGAGSSSQFLAEAFPADRLGVASCIHLDDRTGRIDRLQTLLVEAAAAQDAPVVVGGVSLGGHAAAAAAASVGLPGNVVGCLVCLPAWTGAPDAVAAMTAVAADAIGGLGIAAVLSELDPADWVTPRLAAAWRQRSDADLARELAAASRQPAPRLAQLRRIRVPVGLVALSGDPLHPASVAATWAAAIPNAALEAVHRDEPLDDVAVFADRARAALQAVW